MIIDTQTTPGSWTTETQYRLTDHRALSMWPTRRPVPIYRASDAHEQPRVTDPSGFFLSGLFKSIGSFFRSVFKFVGQVFRAILNSQIGRALILIAPC